MLFQGLSPRSKQGVRMYPSGIHVPLQSASQRFFLNWFCFFTAPRRFVCWFVFPLEVVLNHWVTEKLILIVLNSDVLVISISAGSGASGHSASWGRANQPTSPPYESHLHSLVSNE